MKTYKKVLLLIMVVIGTLTFVISPKDLEEEKLNQGIEEINNIMYVSDYAEFDEKVF